MRARHGVVQSNVLRLTPHRQRPIDSTPARTAVRRSRSVGTAIAATCIAREPVQQNVDAPRYDAPARATSGAIAARVDMPLGTARGAHDTRTQ